MVAGRSGSLARGSRDLNSPRFALGTVQWGMDYGIANRKGRPDESEVRRMLAEARAAGIDTLDTARVYGASEAVIGGLVGADSSWSICTKIDPALLPAKPTTESARAAAVESLRQSRENLRRERLDCALVHDDAHRTGMERAVWNCLRSEKANGGIGLIGTSVGSPEQAFDALADSTVDVIQVASSLLDQRLLRVDFFAEAAKAGKRIFVRSLFLQGVAHLDSGDLPPHLEVLRRPLQLVADWAQQRGWSPAQAFLAFTRRFESATILLGCESAAQLRTNLGWIRAAPPPPGDLAELGDLIPPLPDEVLNPALWPGKAAITQR